jgi:hypothetical protein
MRIECDRKEETRIKRGKGMNFWVLKKIKNIKFKI